MIKKFLFILCAFIFSNIFVLAEINHPETYAEEVIEKVKAHRSSIYEQLDLTAEQIDCINDIDRRFYNVIKPDLIMTAILCTNLEDLANSEECTKKKVKKLEKKIKEVQKDMNSTKRAYNKKFKSVLTLKQRSVYNSVRAKKCAEWEAKCKSEMLEQMQ